MFFVRVKILLVYYRKKYNDKSSNRRKIREIYKVIFHVMEKEVLKLEKKAQHRFTSLASRGSQSPMRFRLFLLLLDYKLKAAPSSLSVSSSARRKRPAVSSRWIAKFARQLIYYSLPYVLTYVSGSVIDAVRGRD